MLLSEKVVAVSRDPNVVFSTHGMRHVIRDMGNGVRLLVDSELMLVGQCVDECALPGRFRLNYPFPAWLDDIRYASVFEMGIDMTTMLTPVVCESYARAIDDRTVEYIGWMRSK